MAAPKRLTEALYRIRRVLWPPFDASEIRRMAEEAREREEAQARIRESIRNMPGFTCPVCGCHYWGTGRLNDDGTARGRCQPNMFMKPCNFSWLRPDQDAEVGLVPYDLAQMAEIAKRQRIQESAEGIVPPE